MDNLEELKNQITKVLNEQIEKTNNELKNLANNLANEFDQQIEKMKNKNESKRWRARINDKYFFVDDFAGVISCHDNNDMTDNYRFKMRNYFKTKEEAQEYKQVMITYYNLMDLAEELNNGRKIDWNNARQQKFYIYVNLEKNALIQGYTFITKDIGQIYCLNENIIGIAAEKIGKDKLIKLFTYERS